MKTVTIPLSEPMEFYQYRGSFYTKEELFKALKPIKSPELKRMVNSKIRLNDTLIVLPSDYNTIKTSMYNSPLTPEASVIGRYIGRDWYLWRESKYVGNPAYIGELQFHGTVTSNDMETYRVIVYATIAGMHIELDDYTELHDPFNPNQVYKKALVAIKSVFRYPYNTVSNRKPEVAQSLKSRIDACKQDVELRREGLFTAERKLKELQNFKLI